MPTGALASTPMSSRPIVKPGIGSRPEPAGANAELAEHACPPPGVLTGPVSRVTWTIPEPDSPSCWSAHAVRSIR